MDLAGMRLDYETAGIDERDFAADPIVQFQEWFRIASEAKLEEPNAMVVSTVDDAGQPWSRYVLLKKADSSGFDFYTNYESNKSVHLAGNARASITFGWLALRRQVNVAGAVERVPMAESDEYWAQRPRGSQLGSLASAQSRPLADRAELDRRYADLDAAHEGDVPRPDHWGGWRLVPHTIEFWQGRHNRMHDRLRYRLDADDTWTIHRLAP